METRKTMDCRTIPSLRGCSLSLSGREDEVLKVGMAHAKAAHGFTDDARAWSLLRDTLRPEAETAPEPGRKVTDCRKTPSVIGCTLVISGSEDEVVIAATDHAVRDHHDRPSAELARAIRQSLADEGSALGQPTGLPG